MSTSSITQQHHPQELPPSSACSTQRLKCQCVLQAPPKSIGDDSDPIIYQSRQPAWQCAFSPDGLWLAVCYGAPDACVRIYRCHSGGQQQQQLYDWRLESTLRGIHTRTIRSLEFAPLSGTSSCVPLILATASFDGTVGIWEYMDTTSNGKEDSWECMAQLEGHDNEVKCVRWNATASLLATCGRDKTVWLWETFLAGAIGGTGSDAPMDVGNFECLAVLNGHQGDVKCIQFAPSYDQWGDGDEILLSASYDDTIKVWAEDAGDWYCAASIKGVHTSTIWSIAIAPSGIRMISGSADCSLAIYKCYTVTERKEIEELADTTASNGNGLWKCVGTLPNAHTGTIYWVSCAPGRVGHGRLASAGGDGKVQVYREVLGSTSDRPLFTLDASVSTLHGDVNHVLWHPHDGSILVSAGDDGSVMIWQYDT